METSYKYEYYKILKHRNVKIFHVHMYSYFIVDFQNVGSVQIERKIKVKL